MTDQRKAILYGLTTVLLWSTVAAAFKLTLRFLNPVELLLYSSLFSTLLLGAILLFQGKLRQAFQPSRRDFLLSMLLGFLNPFLYYLILFEAYDRLPAQQAQPINYTWAITMSLLAVPLLKQKIGRRDWIALVISYCGVVVIATEGRPWEFHFTDPLGVALALASTVIWSLYWIFNTRDTREPAIALFVNFLFSLPFILLYLLLTSPWRTPPLNGIIGALYVGAFEMGICFVLWLKAMKLTDNTAIISNLIFFSPFLSLVFIHFLLGEKILPATFLGLLLIVGGLLSRKIKL
jgi:drug/metabolite transporter (DMT)-like permease